MAKVDSGLVKEVKLPFGFFVGDVLYDTAVIREMTGVEEDILLSQGLSSDIERTTLVIGGCTERLLNSNAENRIEDRKVIKELIENEMTIADGSVLLIELRKLSFGNMFRFEVTCPFGNCGRAARAAYDLTNVEMRRGDEKLRKSKDREYDIKTPSGRKVRLRVLNQKRAKQHEKLISEGKDSVATNTLLLRVIAVDGDKTAVNKLKTMTMNDRLFIRQKFSEVEGGIETDVTVGCPGCKRDFVTILNIRDQDFFFPRVA